MVVTQIFKMLSWHRSHTLAKMSPSNKDQNSVASRSTNWKQYFVNRVTPCWDFSNAFSFNIFLFWIHPIQSSYLPSILFISYRPFVLILIGFHLYNFLPFFNLSFCLYARANSVFVPLYRVIQKYFYKVCELIPRSKNILKIHNHHLR